MSKPVKKHRFPPTICAVCQGSRRGIDDTECAFCFGSGVNGTAPKLVLLAGVIRQQIDPTSIIFRDKAYDVLTQDNERIPYFFLSKRVRYVLVKKPKSDTPIFMVMSDGSMKIHTCYRLTPAGQLIEVG